jgi:hypothetical protein
MDSFDIDKLFERAAGEVRMPTRATHESQRCRAWDMILFHGVCRCENMAQQHDGTCWEHANYYRGWWTQHVPTNDGHEDAVMLHYQEEMCFQIERGHVSLSDPELAAALRSNPGQHLFFQWLCAYADFDGTQFPASVATCVDRIFKTQLLRRTVSYEDAFANLHLHFDRGYIFDIYLQIAISWIADNIQGIVGPANMLESVLNCAAISYRDIAGRRLALAEHFKKLRSQYIASAAEDDRYNSCKGRFWMWISQLKQAERNAYDPLKAELMAATWAPARMPFWCLDAEEVAEEYPEGLPTKAAWAALCDAVSV